MAVYKPITEPSQSFGDLLVLGTSQNIVPWSCSPPPALALEAETHAGHTMDSGLGGGAPATHSLLGSVWPQPPCSGPGAKLGQALSTVQEIGWSQLQTDEHPFKALPKVTEVGVWGQVGRGKPRAMRPLP